MASNAPRPEHGRSAAELVAQFLNTLDVESGEESWGHPAALGAWLVEHAALDGRAPGPDEGDLALAVDLREALRTVLAARTSPDVSPGEAAGPALERLPLVLSGGSLAPQPAPGQPPVRAALARVVAAVVEAQVDGTWDRVKVCARDSCRWAFVDVSRNRSGTWCSMRVCGNREKMRRRSARRDDGR